MHDRDLYSKMLGIQPPWEVLDVELSMKERLVTVMLAYRADAPVHCPECGAVAPRYDAKPRKWRHLDTMQYQTILVADVPRANCTEHGVHQVKVPWSEPSSRFSAMFERLVIDWLKDATTEAVRKAAGLSWDEVDGIMQRAVNRGLARRRPLDLRVIGVDEKAFRKRHEYVTMVCNAENGTVVHVADDRKAKSLVSFYASLTADQRAAVEGVTMDMWPAYIEATKLHLPEALIIFDRFHVSKHLGAAVDKVRRREHRALAATGDRRLLRSKYLWLMNEENLSNAQRIEFEDLKNSELKVARAYALKETARWLWGYERPRAAEKAWKRWIGWAQRCRIEPMVAAGRTIASHLEGILNAAVSGLSNAVAEGLNSRIQTLKQRACGYRNKERFKRAIYFHLGGLDLYPNSCT